MSVQKLKTLKIIKVHNAAAFGILVSYAIWLAMLTALAPEIIITTAA